jgi:DNA repair ATPase RecN
MNWQKEVKNWISVLQQELDGLTAYSSRFSSPAASPRAMPDKFRKVLHVLREGLLNLIDKSNSLLKFSTEPNEKLSKLRQEYQKAMKSLESLYNSFQKKDKAHYKFSTFNSRVRSLSRTDLSPGKERKQKNRSTTPRKKVQFQENRKVDLTVVKKKLKELRAELKIHEHEDYLKKIKKIEKENEDIRKMIQEATSDARENLACLEEMKSRIEKLEMKKGSAEVSSKKQRFLLKTPSQTSDSLLKDFD